MLKESLLIKPIAVIFKSCASIANVVGADFDNITPTPILAAFSSKFQMICVH